MDLQMKECTRDNLCVDCDNDHCIFQGKKESDCPKWRCDMPKGIDCERCEFIDAFVSEMRKGKMQIVIEIPEEEYKRFKKYQDKEYVDGMISVNVIADGTPLPKGHGRIIDESKINKCDQVGLIIKDNNVVRCIVTDAPTIIEKDGD